VYGGVGGVAQEQFIGGLESLEKKARSLSRSQRLCVHVTVIGYALTAFPLRRNGWCIRGWQTWKMEDVGLQRFLESSYDSSSDN
jgi:hypothetical protein